MKLPPADSTETPAKVAIVAQPELEMHILDDWPKFLLIGFLNFAAAWGIILLYELARGVNPYSLPDQERKAYRLASVKASLGFAVIIILYKIILSLR